MPAPASALEGVPGTARLGEPPAPQGTSPSRQPREGPARACATVVRRPADFDRPGDTLDRSPGALESVLLDALTRFIIDNVATYGYLAIFLLMVLESACIPIPSEVTMVFGGALCSATFLAPELQLEFWPVVLAGTLGNLVGSWIAYGVGYAGGRPFVARWGKYVLIRPHEVDKAHDWFERYGEAAVFFGRLLPVIRTFISLPAGVVRMGFWKFTVFTVLGCLPWCIALTWFGYQLGEEWETVERYLRPISWAVAIACVAVVVVFVWHRIRTIRAEEAERATPGEPEPEPVSGEER